MPTRPQSAVVPCAYTVEPDDHEMGRCAGSSIVFTSCAADSRDTFLIRIYCRVGTSSRAQVAALSKPRLRRRRLLRGFPAAFPLFRASLRVILIIQLSSFRGLGDSPDQPGIRLMPILCPWCCFQDGSSLSGNEVGWHGRASGRAAPFDKPGDSFLRLP